MGTMTSPGPCRYHCGSRVGVDVNVNVGRGVSDGGVVGVSVGVQVTVMVAVSVGEGMGLAVSVGSIARVGEDPERSVNPPHPSDNRVAPVIERKTFCKLLQRMIEIPEDSQAFEREPGRDNLDYIGFLRDYCSKPARCDDLHLRTKLFAETFHHSFHHAHITEQQTRLHGMDCVAADNGRWPLQINTRKFCGMRKECFCGEVDASRDCSAQIFAIFRESIECGCCPKIDHARRAAVKIHYRHSICDTVGANSFRVFITHLHARLYTNIDDKWVLIKILLTCLHDTASKLRYYRCKANPCYILDCMICVLQKPLELQTIFIRHTGV